MDDMNELKLKLIQKIIGVDDIRILIKIEENLSEFQQHTKQNLVNEDVAIYQSKIHFTQHQIQMLEEAEKDIENGNFHSDEEVRKMTKEWLK